jgi:hypothetical protein
LHLAIEEDDGAPYVEELLKVSLTLEHCHWSGSSHFFSFFAKGTQFVEEFLKVSFTLEHYTLSDNSLVIWLKSSYFKEVFKISFTLEHCQWSNSSYSFEFFG